MKNMYCQYSILWVFMGEDVVAASVKAELKAHSNESFKHCIFISEIDKYTFMFSLKGKDSELFLLNGVIEIQLMELMPSDQHCLLAVWQWM